MIKKLVVLFIFIFLIVFVTKSFNKAYEINLSNYSDEIDNLNIVGIYNDNPLWLGYGLSGDGTLFFGYYDNNNKIQYLDNNTSVFNGNIIPLSDTEFIFNTYEKKHNGMFINTIKTIDFKTGKLNILYEKKSVKNMLIKQFLKVENFLYISYYNLQGLKTLSKINIDTGAIDTNISSSSLNFINEKYNINNGYFIDDTDIIIFKLKENNNILLAKYEIGQQSIDIISEGQILDSFYKDGLFCYVNKESLFLFDKDDKTFKKEISLDKEYLISDIKENNIVLLNREHSTGLIYNVNNSKVKKINLGKYIPNDFSVDNLFLDDNYLYLCVEPILYGNEQKIYKIKIN